MQGLLTEDKIVTFYNFISAISMHFQKKNMFDVHKGMEGNFYKINVNSECKTNSVVDILEIPLLFSHFSGMNIMV